ncbi:MAG: ThuA domain-containing protein [Pseudomonadota bacterium]
MQVTVWNEFLHEVEMESVRAIYPDGMHTTLVQGLSPHHPDATWVTATLGEPEHGLSQAVLDATDVLMWWGHMAHHRVADEVVDRVCRRVLDGMGLIVMHSGHLSKPFVRLMGTSCNLRWREADDEEIIWSVSPDHPICAGVRQPLVLEKHEMYGEFFDIPAPDELVFISNFSGGEVFRSGCCFQRGKGRIFYFSPGHETYPIFYQPEILKVLGNAVGWAYQPQPSAVETRQSPNAPTGWFRE